MTGTDSSPVPGAAVREPPSVRAVRLCEPSAGASRAGYAVDASVDSNSWVAAHDASTRSASADGEPAGAV